MSPAFNAIKISEHVYWVGAVDNEIRDFHGYRTSRGTTYNAFLILGEKPILIDTVKAPFFSEMMARIRSVIEPEKISYIISNHSEMDHSGSLLPSIDIIKPEKVFASKMGIIALKSHFRQKLDLTEIKNGENFTLGDANLTCLETRMLHWPDSMFTYFANDNILFSQDGFGMHLATYKIFAEENDYSILKHEAMKYYANILLPYSNFVTKLLSAFPSLGLNVKILAPDHGPIWHKSEDISWIMGLWQNWAKQDRTDKVVICYDTMWNSTAKMAAAFADGVLREHANPVVLPLAISHRSDIAAEILEAGALLLGSPALNNQIFPSVADIICYLKGLKRQNLIGQAFGSYGWAGESISLLENEMKSLKIELIDAPIKVQYVPDEVTLKNCEKLGEAVARKLKA
jgi:flavorubredoxin